PPLAVVGEAEHADAIPLDLERPSVLVAWELVHAGEHRLDALGELLRGRLRDLDAGSCLRHATDYAGTLRPRRISEAGCSAWMTATTRVGGGGCCAMSPPGCRSARVASPGRRGAASRRCCACSTGSQTRMRVRSSTRGSTCASATR